MEPIIHFFRELPYNAGFRESIKLIVFLMIGGAIGLFLRALYVRFGLAVTNRNGLSSNFPILIISTVVVIFVVKTSLALSLGLVGALSIVRFRAAIKEPEELVFLFFCIAVGLALGAEYAELALAGVAVFSLFVVIRHRAGRTNVGDTLLLTVTGPEAGLVDGSPQKLLDGLREVVGAFSLQRLEVQDGSVLFRAVVAPDQPEKLLSIVGALRGKFPGCNVSWVSLADLI